MDEIRDYLKQEIANLEWVGDLHIEDGYYFFNTKLLEGDRVEFHNTVVEVVEVDLSSINCYVKLKAEKNIVDFAVKKENELTN